MQMGDGAALQQICNFGRILGQGKFEVVPEAADKEMETEWAKGGWKLPHEVTQMGVSITKVLKPEHIVHLK